MTVLALRCGLAAVDHVELAALLRELAFELWRREVSRWDVVGDIAWELVDLATLELRRKIAADRYAASSGPASLPALARPQRRRSPALPPVR